MRDIHGGGIESFPLEQAEGMYYVLQGSYSCTLR